jgi:SNARE domain.
MSESRKGTTATPPKKMRNSNRHNYSRVSYDSESDREEDDFISQQIRQQQLELKRQDEGLDMLTESANRLGALSLGIHEELNQQNKMLDEMENDLENATGNLETITQKTKDLIQKSGGKKNFVIILAMSIVVVILLFLIIYT